MMIGDRKNFETVELDGYRVETVDGDCWMCESKEPAVGARISVGGLALNIGVCDDCAEEEIDDE